MPDNDDSRPVPPDDADHSPGEQPAGHPNPAPQAPAPQGPAPQNPGLQNPGLHPDDQAWANQFGAGQYAPGQPLPGQGYGASAYSPNPFGPNPFGAAPPAAPLAPVSPTPNLSSAFAWAWDRFRTNASVLIGAAVIWAIVIIAAALIVGLVLGLLMVALIDGAATADPAGWAPTGPSAIAMIVVLTGFMAVIMAYALSCWLTGLIAIADGRSAEFGDFFRMTAFGPILAITLIIAVVSGAAELVFNNYLGLSWVSTIVSMAISLLTMWMVYFAADVREPAGSAISTGFNLATAQIGPTVVVFAMTVLLGVLGLLALVVGLLITIPLSGLLTLYYFRSLTGRPIAA
ncbi:MAG: hypothetical protein WAW85_08985 [Gordonia sp. (in: high G+C Gram-positive bacteria)]|uniref:hypothetical protein n=1 Tax=Gordonia sp. (in: high G+C Gram-positive bacteria) TaxID=84139 RepID=UPI003BB7E5E2